MKYYAGVEGGSSGSTLVVLNQDGQEVYTKVGPSTNPLLDGQEEIFNRIANMIKEAKIHLKLDPTEPIESVGLCLSGCTDEDECNELEKLFLATHPEVSKSCSLRNDTIGSVFASNADSGIAIISGTGQNAILFNKGKFLATCGGWGHFFADEGSGYWIAAKAYKTLLDDNDGFIKSVHDTKRLRQIILRHFQLSDERHIMGFYSKPDKKRVASLCKELYIETKRDSDPAINFIFQEAGIHLANRVTALISKADKEILHQGLKVFCVGSVFAAWDLLQVGFLSVLRNKLDKFSVHQIISSSALGAAKFGAIKFGIDLCIDPKINLLHEHIARN